MSRLVGARTVVLMAILSLLCAVLPVFTVGSSTKIDVFGHMIPDTDNICAAVAYTWLLREQGFDATAYRLEGDVNPETQYVLKALDVDLPPFYPEPPKKTLVAIVDTNNPGELPNWINNVKIHSIVDHHKMGGLMTAEPMEVDVRPLASTNSVIYARAKALNLVPPKHIAGLMLSGILSDTLEFRSPTTTEIDKGYAQELAKLSGLNSHAHAEGMLEAKAQIDHYSAKDLLKMDSKIFTIGGKKLRVSVLETTKPASPLKKQVELVAAMEEMVKAEGLDDVILFVVDIIKEAAVFVSSSPSATKIVEKAWKVTVGADGTVVLPGVLSRKKQMIPKLEAAAKDEL